MVAKIAANGSGPARNGHLDEDGGGHAGRILAAAALLVVLVCGGTFAWLLLSDNRLAGEPVVRVAIAPEEPETPAEPEDVAKADPETSPAETALNEPQASEGDVEDLSADEQALLDAARNLDGGGDSDVSGEVRIVGAESVSGESGEEAGDAGGTPVVLAPAPDPALVEETTDGPLPKIARDGRKPWQTYARPVPPEARIDKRIALVVSGMGISESATAHAIDVLPPEVTLSFAPYGSGLQGWIAKAREAGHEVLLELPMEPFGYPQNDPGPHTLLTGGNADENISRLEWLMSRFTGYAGVMNYQGARFTTSASALTPVMSALGARGLLYVDNGASARSLAPEIARKAGMPAVQATRIVDPVQNPEVIATSLDTLEKVAREKGSAVGVASGFPVTVDALVQWAASLKEEGYVLVPVTALAKDN